MFSGSNIYKSKRENNLLHNFFFGADANINAVPNWEKQASDFNSQIFQRVFSLAYSKTKQTILKTTTRGPYRPDGTTFEYTFQQLI